MPLLGRYAPIQHIVIPEVIGPGVEFPNLGVAGSSPAGRAKFFGLERFTRLESVGPVCSAPHGLSGHATWFVLNSGPERVGGGVEPGFKLRNQL